MTPALTDEEIELDRQWRARFGQPLPMLGCADLVRGLLREAARADANTSRERASRAVVASG